MKASKIALVAAVGLGAVFLMKRANAAQPSQADDFRDSNGVQPGGGGSTASAVDFLASVGAEFRDLFRVNTATATTPTTTAGNASSSVTPGGGSVTAAATTTASAPLQEGVYIKPEWTGQILDAWKSGGWAGLNTAMERYGFGTFNAGQARSAFNLSDSDVIQGQEAGVLSGNLRQYLQ